LINPGRGWSKKARQISLGVDKAGNAPSAEERGVHLGIAKRRDPSTERQRMNRNTPFSDGKELLFEESSPQNINL